MTEERASSPKPPVARVKRHGRFSLVWLIPIVAAGLVVYLAYSTYAKRGPLVTLTLETAEGLQVDQTQVKHKAVPLGTVESIDLSSDMKHVIVKLRMNGSSESVLTDHAKFWVVRPRLSAGSFTGLETIVSGAYIEVDPGLPGGKKQREFTGLADPPGVESDEPGQVFTLKASKLGSLSDGAPVYNRDVEVGELLSYDLHEANRVTLRIFVREPYSKLVKAQSRFWNVSGLSVAMGPEGLHVELASLQAVLSGGIAFETPPANLNDPPAPADAPFTLYGDKDRADSAAYQENLPYVTYFDTSIEGLTRGSPVQLFGVQIGSVTDVRLSFDPDKRRMVPRVAFDLQPERVVVPSRPESKQVADDLRQVLSDQGLRAQLESSSLLTGAKDINLRYTPGVKQGELPREGDAVVVPGDGAGMDSLTSSMSDVAHKVDKIPFEQIGTNLNMTLASFQHLATQIDASATPALQRLPALVDGMSKMVENANGALGSSGYGQNSEFEHGMKRVMDQVGDAARSFRSLADYLDRHPEALIRGRQGVTEAQ
ncbi:MAG TPA: MlaD family protein [Polyangiaceae bacterium]|jgi:paraquat-inducible protein B|nr:MlaD family protein [Polyangiaceae bacterium]